VYGSDAPPNVTAANGTYTLYGTPPFILTAAGGTATQTVAATSIATSAVTITPVTLTDETGYPGVFCIYTGSDLYIDGTHLCQTRASGALNWEAWIKDTRDDELYRIVLMPDDNWWLAQNVKIVTCGTTTVGVACPGDKDECGRAYHTSELGISCGGTSGSGTGIQGICPNGWILPTTTEYSVLANSVSSDQATVAAALQSKANTCSGGVDSYGWASLRGQDSRNNEHYKCNDTSTCRYGFTLNDRIDAGSLCGRWYATCSGSQTLRSSVRCHREV
jgi:uncharacterized protein (TIGR02145 family)